MTTQELKSETQLEQMPGLHAKMFDERKSNLQKYQDMTVGHGGLLTLLRYEITMLFFSQIPGALGLVLRQIFYTPLFKSVGRNVIFGRNLTVRHPHKISLGDNIIIDDDCLLDAKGTNNEGIHIGNGFTIGRFSSLVCKNGSIKIGNHVNIGTSVKIVVGNGGTITIGNSLDIGSSCHLSGGSYDYSQADVLPSSQRQETKGITIEDMAWVGAGTIILDGTTIGSKSIVGAGSVVNRDVPSKSVAAGVPAKVIRQRD